MSGQRRRPRPTVPVIVGVVVVLGLVAAALRPEWNVHPLQFDLPDTGTTPQPQQSSGGANTPPTQRPEPGNVQNLAVVGWVLLGLLAAGAALILGLLIRRLIQPLLDLLRSRRPAQPVDTGAAGMTHAEPDLSTVQQGTMAAQQSIDRFTEPGDAIVAAWLELERAASASGVERSPAQTPTEFTTDVLARTAADDRATQTLLRLYLHARFSSDVLTGEDLAQARQSVHDLARSWDQPTGTGHPDQPGSQQPGSNDQPGSKDSGERF